MSDNKTKLVATGYETLCKEYYISIDKRLLLYIKSYSDSSTIQEKLNEELLVCLWGDYSDDHELTRSRFGITESDIQDIIDAVHDYVKENVSPKVESEGIDFTARRVLPEDCGEFCWSDGKQYSEFVKLTTH